MKCRWCSNPEGISHFPVLLYNAEKCIHDNLCVSACNQQSAISSQQSAINNTSELSINRNICDSCSDYKCVKACNTGALKVAGYYISAEELMFRIQKDRNYWGENGGITLTGGEPFCQPDFAIEILKNCYNSYIHTAIETCGNVPWKYYAEALEYIDWIFYDIKNTDHIKHKEWTGVDNKLILENAEKLSRHFKGRIIIRIPLVPGFNDSEKEITDTADFMNKAGIKEVNILPLHNLGMEKYKLLGLPYFTEFPIPGFQSPLSRYKEIFEDNGLICYEGYKTPF